MASSSYTKGRKQKEKVKSIVLSGDVLFERQECLCEATKHPLINNCLNCGRIVCQQEGSGPCFTCSLLVCTNEETDILHERSGRSLTLYKQLTGHNLSLKNVGIVLGKSGSSKLEEAVAHKNMLLDFNKPVEMPTKVVDDAGDYFDPDSNRWLTTSQKELLHKKQEEEAHQRYQRATKVAFDFAGRHLVEEAEQKEQIPPIDVDELLKDDTSIFDFPELNCPEGANNKVQYVYSYPALKANRPASDKKKDLRIQDEELQYMSDQGMCLSIHQPFASLILAGIKKHEGQSWYTSFRGRLWIHSCVRVPSQEEIGQIEDAYHEISGATEFPRDYCCGSILGCVDLIDCLPQEQYREKFPEGEVGSDYAFIFENPRALKIAIPMNGRRKIFKMGYKFHDAAKKVLRKL